MSCFVFVFGHLSSWFVTLLHLGVFPARSPQLLVAFTFLLLVIILHFCGIFHFGRLDANITIVAFSFI